MAVSIAFIIAPHQAATIQLIQNVAFYGAIYVLWVKHVLKALLDLPGVLSTLKFEPLVCVLACCKESLLHLASQST